MGPVTNKRHAQAAKPPGHMVAEPLDASQPARVGPGSAQGRPPSRGADGTRDSRRSIRAEAECSAPDHPFPTTRSRTFRAAPDAPTPTTPDDRNRDASSSPVLCTPLARGAGPARRAGARRGSVRPRGGRAVRHGRGHRRAGHAGHLGAGGRHRPHLHGDGPCGREGRPDVARARDRHASRRERW
jgi:hypothetical protein